MVAVTTHPDAAAEGAERIAVVFAAMLLQELLIVYFGVLELIAVVAIGQQGRGEDHLVEHTGRIAVVVGAIAFLMQLVHGVEKLAVAQVFHVARCTQVVGYAFAVRVVVVVAHHDDFGALVLTHDGVGDVTAEVGSGHTARHGAFLAAGT